MQEQKIKRNINRSNQTPNEKQAILKNCDSLYTIFKYEMLNVKVCLWWNTTCECILIKDHQHKQLCYQVFVYSCPFKHSSKGLKKM